MIFAVSSSSVILGVCLTVWFLVALISLVVEIETFQLVSVWFFIGSVAAIITTAIAPKNVVGIFIQLVVFTVVSVITLLLFRPLCKKKLKVDSEASKDINSMIGLTGLCLSTVNETEGFVDINGTTWSARAGEEIVEGSKIHIVKQDNLILYVEKIKEEKK